MTPVGTLVLVVGPSGAGKDTLLGAARTALAAEPQFRFVRRVITRPPQPGLEDNEVVDAAEFARRRDAGGFALHWAAHGLHYGIPTDVEATLQAGGTAVASVSRAVIADAAARYRMRLIEITAPPDVLARRLLARGREDAGAVTERLARSVPLPAGVPVLQVMNDGPVAAGRDALVALLRDISDR